MSKTQSTGDRHNKRWMLGIPLHYRALFEQLARANRRTLIAEVSIALEAHLRAAGLWPPAEGQGGEEGE